MAVIGLDHFNIRTPLAVAQQLRDFYCEVLGLRDGERPPFNSRGFWLYAGNDPILHLSVAGDDAPGSNGMVTLDHVALNATDIDAMRGRLDQLGIPYTMKEVPLRRQTQVFLRDPAGNGIELNFAHDNKAVLP